MTVKANEREFTSQVVSWLNETISPGDSPFEVASAEVSLKVSSSKTNFPDIQIWLNREAGLGFCGWELKTPTTPADDKTLLEDAARKARAIHADYFVTWNMRDAVIWRTPLEAENVLNEHRLKTYPSILPVTEVKDLWVVSKQELLKGRAREILYDLSNLYRDGHLHLIDTDSTFFVSILSKAVETLVPCIHQSVIAKMGRDRRFQNNLRDWAVKQAIANYEDPAFYETVSRQAVYRSLGKILFYLTLRKFRTDLPAMQLKGINPTQINQKLEEYFAQARRIDYQAVFESDFTDSIPIPPEAADTLTRLIDDLNRFNFSHMPQDVVGNVFERLIPPSERHTLGQYFTSENLVDLINAFCIRTNDAKVLDPTCGTGTFLIRAYDRLKSMGEREHKTLLSRIWGFDVAHFPAELATINLYRQNISDYRNFPRIIAGDFFDVKMGQIFKFPPPKATGNDDYMLDEELPAFDAIVGNFPYIRQELIEKKIKGYKDKLTKALLQDWQENYPELFDRQGELKLSGQADIYAYLFFHTACFLKEDGGRMGIVTSNSWLDVAYGYELQKFFLKNFKVIAILESRCEPWFEDAAVNTVVTILEITVKPAGDEHLVKFVKLKKRLNDLIPWDMKLEAQRRHMGLDKLVHKIESDYTFAGLTREKVTPGFTDLSRSAGVSPPLVGGLAGDEPPRYADKTPSPLGEEGGDAFNGPATHEDDELRIRAVGQGALLKEIEAAGKTVKWGRYLRAPEIYFEILDKCKDKLVPLSPEVAEVRRGYTTGINEFFYLDEDKINHWGIEEFFLAPVIRSPKEAKGILLKSNHVSHKIFLCSLSKEELRKYNRLGALKYIEWGETQQTKEGIPWPEVSTVSNRKLWHDVGERVPGKILLQMITNERFFAPYNVDNIQVDHNLFELFPNGDYSYGLGMYLNSTIVALFRELASRVNLGDGATKTEGIDWKDILTPNADILKTLSEREKSLEALSQRPIQSIFEEVKLKDRQRLDSLVLEAIGLDPKQYLKPIYDGIFNLVHERISLAEMRKKVKKGKTEKDVEMLKTQVMDEVVPNGLKVFPESYIDSRYFKDAEEITVPTEPLKLGNYFMGQQEIISESGFSYTASSRETANFIIYSQKPDSYIVKLPKDNILITKAVKEYERYLQGIKAKFFEAFFSRTHDHKLTQTLTGQVIKILGISVSQD